MLRKTIAWLLAIMMVLTVAPLSAFATEAEVDQSQTSEKQEVVTPIGEDDVTGITSGTFAKDPSDYVAEGYAALPNLDGAYVVGEKPTATVNNLGSVIVPAGDYGIWDGKNYTSKGTVDMSLNFVMQFLADQTAEDMETSPFAEWYGDFVITFTGLKDGQFEADGCYLAGYYGNFGWVKVPVDDMIIEEGVRYPVMLGVGLGQKYDYICSGVKDFQCALYLTPEVLAANPDLNINLALVLVDNSKGEKAAAEALVKNENVYKVVDFDYAALPNLDGEYIMEKKPTATVNNLGSVIVPAGGYGVWDGKNYTSKGTVDMPLSFVMQFLADQDKADMATSLIADWYGDFVITFTGLEGASFVADGCYLAGYYGNFGWVKVPVDGMTIEEGVHYPVMLGVGLGQKYDYICSGVKDFQCALYLTPEVLAANPDLNINLALVLVDNSKGEDAAAEAIVDNTNIYPVVDYNFGAEDFGMNVKVSNASGDSYYATLAGAFAAAEDGDTITLLADIALNATVVNTKTVTLDFNGKSVTGAGINSEGNLTIIDSVRGGIYAGDLEANGGTLAVKGGTFAKDPSDYVADGYAALPTLDGVYIVDVKPTATVNNLGSIIVPAGGYGVWDGKNYTSKGTVDMPLSFVMQFLADQDKADMATSLIADWYGDFVITFTGLEGASFVADGCYLAGYYGNFGWVKVPVDGMTIEEGVHYPVMLGVGLGQKYDYICSGVKDFQCALYLTPEVLAANPDLNINLALVLVDNSKGEDAAAEAIVDNTNIYPVVDYNFGAEDFGMNVKVSNASGDSYYATLAGAFAAAEDGDTITLLADIALNATVVNTKTVTLDLAGHVLSGTCNASQASLVYVENNAELTVKDSVGEGKITFAQGSSNVGWTVDVKGKFVLESGTIELTGSWSIGYAVDIRPNSWGTEYTKPSVFVMEGGAIISSDGGVRVASSSADGHKNVSASFVMNDGLIDAAWDGVFIQQSNATYDDLSFVMNGGTIESDLNPVRVYGSAPTGYVNDQNCMTITLAGGTMTYTGNETREWVIDGILRVGGGSSVDTILDNGALVVSEAIATSAAAPAGYKWVETTGGYTLAECDYVAQIGETKYETLEEALAADVEGDVILLKPYVVAAGETVTLDLNGKTVVYSSDVAGEAMIANKGTLTIKNGTLAYTYTGAATTSKAANTISNNGTLTIEGVNVSNTTTANGQIGYAIDNFGSLTVNSGTITATGSNYYDGIRMFCASESNEVSVTVNGGEISSIWMQNASDGASDKNTKDVLGSLTITDGTIGAVWLEPSSNFEAAITGGVITKVVYNETSDGRDLIGFITGGTYTEKPDDAMAAEGYVFKENADGTYGVKLAEYVAQIGETKYETLEEALAADVEGDVILLKPYVVAAGETVTLDLNGKTVVYSSDVAGEAMIANKGTLTIKNGTLAYTYTGAATTSKAANTISNNGTLTIEGVNVSNTTTANGQIGYAIDNFGSLTVNSGTITATGSNYYDGIRMFCASESNEVSVTVNGGEISSIWMQNASDGASDKNTKDVLGSLTITDGTIGAVWLEPSSNFEAAITGGVITKVVYNETSDGRDLIGFITGGTYTEKPDDAMAPEGYIFEENAEGTYNVVLEVTPEPSAKVSITDTNGNVTYSDSLAMALMTAPTGATVTVLEDLVENAMIAVFNGVILDLNGKVVEVFAVSTFGDTARIIDSADVTEKGLLKVAKGNLALGSATYPMFPLWNEEGTGYIFVDFRLHNVGLVTDGYEDGSFMFWFRPSIGSITTQYFKDGAADNELSVGIKLELVKADGTLAGQVIDFSVPDSLLQGIYDGSSANNTIQLTVNGVGSSFSKVNIMLSFISERGMIYTTDTLATYTVPAAVTE